MSETTIFDHFLKELNAEEKATHKCLERIPVDLFDWQPHEKSMKLGYLALLVAEIPKWITAILQDPEIDFATFEHFQPKSTEELVKHFEENMESARAALKSASTESLPEPFYLKSNGETMVTSTRLEMLEPTINHLVHHRGQLTVFMRLKDIPVPSIYGPSADDRSF